MTPDLTARKMDEDNRCCNVDICFVIDVTGGMDPVLDMFRQNCIGFRKMLSDASRWNIQDLRVRIIGSRDFEYDKDSSIEESEFFELGEREPEMRTFLEELGAYGGGDEPDTTLDAISMAMKSDWNMNGRRRRHIIMCLTDSNTKLPGHGPSDLPGDMDAFKMWWQDAWNAKMDQRSKRLIVISPSVESWNIIEELDDSLLAHDDSPGLSEVTMEHIINLLSVAL